MKLHANAALSWQGRRLLSRRVVEQKCSVSAAASAARVSVLSEPLRVYWRRRLEQHTADNYMGVPIAKFPEICASMSDCCGRAVRTS